MSNRDLIERLKKLADDTCKEAVDNYAHDESVLIRKAAEALQAMEWQPIESMPIIFKGENSVLVKLEVWGSENHTTKPKQFLYWDIVVLKSEDIHGDDELECGWKPSQFTHWMPLPTPPQEGN